VNLGLVARHLMRGEKTGDKCYPQSEMEVLAISSAVRDFHVYKLSISDKLACERDFDICFDKFTISVGPFSRQVLEDSVVPPF